MPYLLIQVLMKQQDRLLLTQHSQILLKIEAMLVVQQPLPIAPVMTEVLLEHSFPTHHRRANLIVF
jgi:hypothetical protein